LLWRGIALSFFDGRRWTNDPWASSIRPVYGRYDLVAARRTSDSASHADQGPLRRPLSYRVTMEPIGTNPFVLAARTTELRRDYGALAMDHNGSVLNRGLRTMISSYEATSDVDEPDAQVLDQPAAAYPPAVTNVDLQTPRLDPRVAQLAASITDGESTPYRKA